MGRPQRRPRVNARIVCIECKAQRDAEQLACSVCGSVEFAYVRATRGDLNQAEQEVIEAAEVVTDVLTRNVRVTRSQDCAQRLATACRALVFARAGFIGT